MNINQVHINVSVIGLFSPQKAKRIVTQHPHLLKTLSQVLSLVTPDILKAVFHFSLKAYKLAQTFWG